MLTTRFLVLCPVVSAREERLANVDTDIQTNVPPGDRSSLGIYNPFQIGSRLYLTAPTGERVGFTFNPQRPEIPGLTYYTPAWVADPGVDYTLQSAEAMLTLGGDLLYDPHLIYSDSGIINSTR